MKSINENKIMLLLLVSVANVADVYKKKKTKKNGLKLQTTDDNDVYIYDGVDNNVVAVIVNDAFWQHDSKIK